MPSRLLPLSSLRLVHSSITLLSLLAQPSCELSHKNENSINSGKMKMREEGEAQGAQRQRMREREG